MRWSNLSILEEERTRLPGYRDEALVRHFEAPDAVQTRFYEVRAKSILNRVPKASRMPFRWTINPYRGCSHACVYCFARPTHTYLDFDAGRDFEREIVVKVNAPELLRRELAKPSWAREHVALGTNTDPYQWVEGRYKLMPGIWAALRDAGNPCSILTKSPLLLRDLPLMVEIAQRTDFSAALSVPTIDERAWRATEPHTPNPRARLEAVAALTRAGIRTGVLVAPLMPGINDAPEQVAEILELASAAGAAYVSGIALHMRGDVKGLFFRWLEDNRPDLIPLYQRLYKRGAYMALDQRRRLASLVNGPDLEPEERMRGRSNGHLRPSPDASDRSSNNESDRPADRGTGNAADQGSGNPADHGSGNPANHDPNNSAYHEPDNPARPDHTPARGDNPTPSTPGAPTHGTLEERSDGELDQFMRGRRPGPPTVKLRELQLETQQRLF